MNVQVEEMPLHEIVARRVHLWLQAGLSPDEYDSVKDLPPATLQMLYPEVFEYGPNQDLLVAASHVFAKEDSFLSLTKEEIAILANIPANLYGLHEEGPDTELSKTLNNIEDLIRKVGYKDSHSLGALYCLVGEGFYPNLWEEAYSQMHDVDFEKYRIQLEPKLRAIIEEATKG